MKKRGLFSVLPWIAALLLLGWVLYSVPLADAWKALQQLQMPQILFLVIINGFILVLLNSRWWIILRSQGERIPFFSLLGYRLATFGVSYFTPGPHMGGEPLQIYLVEKEQGTPRATAIAALSLDKSLELLVNFAFLLAGVILIFRQRTLGGVVRAEAIGFAVALLLIPAAYLTAVWMGSAPLTGLMRQLLHLPLESKLPRWRARIFRAQQIVQTSERETTRFCRQSPRALFFAFLVTILGWLLMISEFWLMVSFLGIPLTPLQLITALTAARIAILLLLPGGFGVLEASQALAFGAMGLNPAIGISTTLLIRLRDVLIGVVGLWWGSKKLSRNHIKQRTEGGKIS
ncbi:MAG: lysylphosphatidylglycerol synthase transmembrane domain-containing protein [Candidatus Promineifilaceae bacterium]|nr:lysylphosphatidylglycerol synthase transmembrane domain-containing protein [Candidatus Promineifilaceae bacterium]